MLIFFIVSNASQFIARVTMHVFGQFGELGALVGYTILTTAVVFYIWIGLAAAVRRLHDRAKPGWWSLPLWVAPHLLFGIGVVALQGNAGLATIIASFALFLWGIIELGGLKGTAGPNAYGPDPIPADAGSQRAKLVE